MPANSSIRNGIRWAPVARATADYSRDQLDVREVRALVASVVQRRSCTLAELAEELHAGPKRGSHALRAALAEVADGVASVAEGDLRKLIKAGRLPEPMYNPKLYIGSVFLAQPDLWWRDSGVAGELDSRAWHLSPDDWARTLARHAKMTAHGIFVLHFTLGRVRADGQGVLAELRSAIESGRQRPPLPIRAVPSR